ncbi:helix-turn-helix domain-containing protein [Pseudooceanicola sp.]|uniref:helix-turn-helix domain-containing protein n=1 Tax=Pseudooceanicola sp. TaxID=1914328 RepID=UPI0040585E1A
MAKRHGKRPEEGQYAPLPYALLKSDAWRALSGPAVKVFLELHTRFNGSNNADLRLSYAEAAKALHMGKATVQRAFRDLQAKGFVVLVNKGNFYHRHAHEWRITTKGVHRVRGKELPTHDWRAYRPAKTERGSDTGHDRGRAVPHENPSGAARTELEPVKPVRGGPHGSGTEHL